MSGGGGEAAAAVVATLSFAVLLFYDLFSAPKQTLNNVKSACK